MQFQFPRKWPLPAFAGALLLLIGCGVIWLKAEHEPMAARQVAEEFLVKLQAGDFRGAHELTLKNTLVGKTAQDLARVSQRQLCKVTRLASTSPFQSNGNRMRRRALGMEVEMPEVRVEFEGACLLGVTVRHTASGSWKVFNFASHAG